MVVRNANYELVKIMVWYDVKGNERMSEDVRSSGILS